MSEGRNRASLPNKPAASAGSALAVPASQVGQPRSARTSTLAKRTSSAADLPIDGAGAPKRLVATAPVASQASSRTSIASAAGSETNTSEPAIDTSMERRL
ncbi:unnamed protein product [Tilletia controversa]|uniref:Uncharacterized protein n=1 Tax=Tilletia caries TaxID=13290 RepID=A0ABN7IQV7_9BASI|nr:unnamed protein product [Tilletia caries]CAD6929746.1 unnamed protein product [Tilletia controversa]CAD7062089.1 unnamed protein product [Tilletia caries]